VKTITEGGAGNYHTNIENCAVTFLSDTFYLALSDETTGVDNVSVWKSTDLATWTQIGIDFVATGDVHSVAIATTGTSASDNGVWVAINDGGDVDLLHYEDIAGGTTYAWRAVGTLLAGATTNPTTNPGGNISQSRVSIATDGVSIIGVSAIVSAEAKTNFWYNQ
jgi:hypothetical protein